MCLVGCLSVLATNRALAKDYYVATTGSNANAGTMDQPFATLQHGADVAVAGDTVYIRGGTYTIVGQGVSSTAGIEIKKSGTSDANRIKFWAYNGEVPIFDFSKMTVSNTDYTPGFHVTGSWLHFKGLEICNVPMNTRSNNGMLVENASNDIFELMNFHHNNGAGFFISHGNGGHLILNSDSHDNYDPTSSQGAGQNADGFGCHYQASGTSTTFRGCRAWWNSDDGYDLISQEYPVIIENSWAMANGYINSGTAKPGSGNGNGFKAGSSKTGVRHTLSNCVAWRNVAAGFYANHSSGGNNWYNNTSYNNGTQYNMLASSPTDSSVTIILSGSLVHKMRNNIGFPNKNTNMDGVDTAANSWDLNLTPAAADFVSVTDTGAMGARQSDGSTPNLDFMKLVAGSQMIDKGTDVGLPFVGAKPDLGAYEFGATETGAGGGSGGSGGTSAGGTGGTGGAVGVSGTTGIGSGGMVTGPTGGAGGGATASAGNIGSGGSVVAQGGGSPENGGSAPTGTTLDSPAAASGCSCVIGAGSEHRSAGSTGAVLSALCLVLNRRRRGRKKD